MPDIRINVAFNDRESVSVDLVTRVTRDIEKIVYRAEHDLLLQTLATLGDEVDAVTRDAALYRFDQMRGRSVLIESTDRGSLLVSAVVAGLAFWVLKETVGASFKEAWKGSKMDRRLQAIFRSDVGQSADRIVQWIQEKYVGPAISVAEPQMESVPQRPSIKRLKWHADEVYGSQDGEGRYTINLNIIVAEIVEMPATYGELLDQDNDSQNMLAHH